MSVATRNVSKTVPIDPLWEFDAPKIFDFVKMTDDDGIDSWFGNQSFGTYW